MNGELGYEFYMPCECGKELPREPQFIIPHTEQHIIDIIKANHPDWGDAGGMCKQYYEYYKRQLNLARIL
jgi:hypothetical protein